MIFNYQVPALMFSNKGINNTDRDPPFAIAAIKVKSSTLRYYWGEVGGGLRDRRGFVAMGRSPEAQHLLTLVPWGRFGYPGTPLRVAQAQQGGPHGAHLIFELVCLLLNIILSRPLLVYEADLICSR